MNDPDDLIAMLEKRAYIDARQRTALIELHGRIVERYPDAKFEIMRGIDEPDMIYLIAETELEDPDVVIDLVIDRVVDLLVEEDVHVAVVSVPGPVRNAEIHAENLRRQREIAEARLAAT